MSRLRGGPGCVLAWLIGRAVLLVGVLLTYRSKGSVGGDVALYAGWARVLRAGSFPPAADATWQYPPGAAGVLVLPALPPGTYYLWFLALLLLADLAVLVLLLLRVRAGESAAGPWTWVIGVPALGTVVLGRFDLVPTALGVAGVLAVRVPVAAGLLLGAGGLVKLWPAVLLPLARSGSRTGWPGWARAAAGAAGTGVFALGVLLATGTLRGSFGFAGNTGGRGLQIEAVAATPYMVARALGAGPTVTRRYGAYEVVGAGVAGAVTVTTAATVVLLAGYVLLVLRRRAHPPEPRGLALTVVLGLVMVSKVLSPQYLLWCLGLAAAAALGPDRRQRLVAAVLVLAATVTQLLYPLMYDGLRQGAVLPTLLLVLRNGLLVLAAVLAGRAAVTGSG